MWNSVKTGNSFNTVSENAEFMHECRSQNLGTDMTSMKEGESSEE